MAEKKQDSKVKAPSKSAQSSSKDEAKMKELKIELLKQTSKKRDVKKEIARLLTLQNKNMEEKTALKGAKK